MKTYRCPTCGKKLTRTEYERALKIQGAKEAHFHKLEVGLKRKDELRRQQAREREKRLKEKHQGDMAQLRQKMRLRAEQNTGTLKRTVERLKEEVRRLKSGSTPQTDGLEFEEKLVARLRKEFPDDEILHKGKGGDILHTVRFGKKPAGVIIYECKRTPRIQGDHVAQAHRAKQVRQADFAVLVTTARKKGFSGFSQMGGVWIVAPLATIPLVALLRDHLIEMLKAKITKEKRAAVAQQLMRYIDSPQFKNPIEEMVQRTTKLQEMIKKEARDHFRIWQDRWGHYQTIRWNATQVQANLQLVLHGNTPRRLAQPRSAPLQLPALTPDR